MIKLTNDEVFYYLKNIIFEKVKVYALQFEKF